MSNPKTFPDGTTHRRYDLRSERGGWLATVFLGAEGILSTVSDYGNYGYWWGSVQDDFRAFLCRIDDGYLLGKVSPGEEVDEKASEAGVKACILRLRREKRIDADTARDEWDLLSYVRDGDEGGWWAQTTLGEHADPMELWSWRSNQQAVAFCERVMPRLREMLRAELAAERKAA